MKGLRVKCFIILGMAINLWGMGVSLAVPRDSHQLEKAVSSPADTIPLRSANQAALPLVVIKAQMDKYFELKKIEPEAAKILLQQILQEDPANLIANKEMGYLLLNDNHLQAAIARFYTVLEIDPEDEAIIKQLHLIKKQLQNKQLNSTEKLAAVVLPFHHQMDDYYTLKKTNSDQALHLLKTMLQKKPNDPILNAEMGYHLLKEKNVLLALHYFNQSLRFDPHNKTVIGQVNYIEASVQEKKNLPVVKLSETDQLLNQYYTLKKHNPQAATFILQKLVRRYPANLTGQREMAFSLLNEKKFELALQHLFVVEQLTPNDDDIKMQIAYVLANLGCTAQAYTYFSKVTATNDPALKLRANQALTNLGGMQTKIFPKPWFADLYLSPLYYSRFNLIVLPLQARVGRTFGEKEQGEIYLINRTTWDDRSGQAGLNQLPQIFEDDVSIIALGVRYTPFYNSTSALGGLKLYVEGGKAYSLINEPPNPRWRNDLRGGLLYFYGWGALHEYVDHLILPFKQIGTVYGDMSYFSRYNNNVITYASLKEGLRIAEYRTTEINFYLRVRGGFDTNREFFNNFVETGPGLEIVPNNRYNLVIRLESLKGFYIKVNSPSPNPYGPTYTNNLAIVEFYARF